MGHLKVIYFNIFSLQALDQQFFRGQPLYTDCFILSIASLSMHTPWPVTTEYLTFCARISPAVNPVREVRALTRTGRAVNARLYAAQIIVIDFVNVGIVLSTLLAMWMERPEKESQYTNVGVCTCVMVIGFCKVTECLWLSMLLIEVSTVKENPTLHGLLSDSS